MRRVPIFYNALMLTGVNLLLRLVSTSFQVFVSGRIGPAGVGLLQLVMSVASLSMTAGIAGIRTATMYLTAEELGRKKPQNVAWVLSGCFVYSLLCSGAVAGLVYGFAPRIAAGWIGNAATVGAIRLFAAFLPLTCMSGVMTGYFTGAGRIGTLALVEVAEQLCSMAVTASMLLLWAGRDPSRACQAVIFGSCAGSCLTLGCLAILRIREHAGAGERIPISRRLGDTALPLAVADDLKAGISTLENLMVPKRLSLYTADALSQFGLVCGMVFPVLMFPAAILYGLADLLIPELARCRAAGSWKRICYLARRSLRLAVLYGTVCGGVLFLLAEPLCRGLYGNEEAGRYLRQFALLAPMLYCDAIVDAAVKGLGQQKLCVRFNILTTAMDVALLFVLLPKLGMQGYFFSFLVTHAVNAALSLGLLLRLTKLHIPLKTALGVLGAMIFCTWGASHLQNAWMAAGGYVAGLGSLLYLLQIVGREDLLWLRGLLRPGKNMGKTKEFFENNI